MIKKWKPNSGVYQLCRILWQKTLLVLAVFLIVQPMAAQEEGTQTALLELRYSPSSDNSREIALLFSADAPEPASVLAIQAPPRLIFVFDAVINQLDQKQLQINDGVVERVIALNHPDRTDAARVVVDLVRDTRFEMRRVGSRLVINVKVDTPVAETLTAKPAIVGSPPPEPSCNPRTEPCQCQATFFTRRPGSFTLQMLSVKRFNSLKHWFNLNENREACYYRYQSGTGEQWYSLVSGQFDSRAAAARAIDTLPAGLRAAGPWPISMRRLQSRISHSSTGQSP